MEAEDETKVVARDLSESDSDGSESAVESSAANAAALDGADETPVAADADVPRDQPHRSSSSSSIDLLNSHRLVGRYELIHRLGYGGMATVFLGRAIGTAGFERLVAVKVIHPHLANEPEFVEMFLDEARIAAKIHHPHVVEIIDLGQDDELFFMVMEYVEGENLAALLREFRKHDEPFELSAALQIISDVLGGLAAAHNLEDHGGKRYELVHRDVSPHNFLISMNGRVRVVDFGIMKAAGKRSTTLTGQLRGKVPYMSPEQAKAKPVDHRTDIFAVGAVLWEMLAGERLFLGETESETLAKVVRCEVPDVFERREELPEGLRPILDKALAADPGDRYETAEQMLKDVRSVLRQLDEDEPREVLAGYMKRFFQGRVDYIRASVRGYASSEASARSGASMNDLSFSKTTPLGAAGSAMGRLTPSHPPLGPATLTTSPGVTARQWPVWLLLPLAGAAIGTFVVRTWDSGATEAPRGAPPAAEMTPASTDPPKADRGAPSAEPRTVKWWFNSYPQGAIVSIDGVPHPKPTPVAIELPYSDDPVEVRVEKEGYEAHVVPMAPLGNQTVPVVRLEALEVQADPESDAATPPKPMPRFKARTKPKTKSKKPSGDASSDAEPSKADPAKPDEPQLGDMPDFDLVRKKKTP